MCAERWWGFTGEREASQVAVRASGGTFQFAAALQETGSYCLDSSGRFRVRVRAQAEQSERWRGLGWAENPEMGECKE